MRLDDLSRNYAKIQAREFLQLTYGTYQVSGNKYNTELKEAVMSIGSTSVPIPDMTSYQSGTWSRTGDTLTMIPIGSATKVFKILETPQTLPPAKVWTGTESQQKTRKQHHQLKSQQNTTKNRVSSERFTLSTPQPRVVLRRRVLLRLSLPWRWTARWRTLR